MLDRRQFMASSLTLAMLGAARPAFTATLAVPVVDRLTVQVMVDNATFGPFLPNETRPGLDVRRRTGDGGARMGRTALAAEFGLSVLAISQLGAATRRVLIDFGYTAHALANNMRMLGIDPASIDAAVLSHGHLDHYGGFAGLFEGRSPDRPIPLLAGGEETFCERVAMIDSPPPVMGALDRTALMRAGLRAEIAPEPSIVVGQAFTSGTIPLRSFECTAIPTAMRPGVGCDATRLPPAKAGGHELPDDGEHELATCYAIRDLGLVVISSCSHRGIINAVRQAQAISGIDKVHAVIGGFHLVRPRTEAEALRTVAELRDIDPTYIVPMHCTGEVFIAEALRLMPDKVVRPYVGTELVFLAA